MSTKTVSTKVSPTGDTTWGGNMELANNTSITITNVSFEHWVENGAPTVTFSAASLENNGDLGPVAFTTASGETDYWFISFLDDSKNLITGMLTKDFHSGSAKSTVEISLNPTSFSVTISGSTSSATYFQKDR